MAYLIMGLYLAKLSTCKISILVIYFLLHFIMNYAYSVFYPNSYQVFWDSESTEEELNAWISIINYSVAEDVP